MEIIDDVTTLEAFIGICSGKINSVSFIKAPSAKIKINNIEELGLFSEELYALLDIKKAIDDQIFLIRKIISGRNIHQNNEIYYAINEGSIDIQAVFDVFKKLLDEPGLSKRGLCLVLGLAFIWASPSWYNTWAEIKKVKLQEQTKIELKELDMKNETLKRNHELELKAIDIIKKDKELQKLALRTYDAFAKIYQNIRSGSDVIINALPLNDEQITLFLRSNSTTDDWSEKIEGSFKAHKLKKKGKELYQIELINVDTHRHYNVAVNMDFYNNNLLSILHEWHKKGNSLFVHLQFFRKDGNIIRTELTQIGENKLSHYLKQRLTRR